MFIQSEYFRNIIESLGELPDSIKTAKASVERYQKRNKQRSQSQEFLLSLAMYYKHCWNQQHDIAYFKLAKASFERALKVKTVNPANNLNNQIHYEFGELFLSKYLLDDESAMNGRYAVAHFQAVGVEANQGCDEEKETYKSSRLNIISIYQYAPSVTDALEFNDNKKLVRNDINVLVAHIDLFQRGHYLPETIQVLARYANMNRLHNGELEFLDDCLDLRQAYKVARLCKDRQLITPQNYLNILWKIESVVENDRTLHGQHLRKKTRYQLLLTLIDLYRARVGINLDGFNALYEKLMAKKSLFTFALLRGDQKAKNVKAMMDQVFEKGVRRVYQQHSIYTPITHPLDYLLDTYANVTAITRPVAKWPLYIIGSVLDVVLVIPVLAKIFSALTSGLRSGDPWGRSWFTGLLGTVIGEWMIGYGVGGLLAVGLAAVTYPIKLGFGLLRRAYEWCVQGRHEREVRSVPLHDNLNQEALQAALNDGLDVKRKPAAGFLAEKKYDHYPVKNSYSQVFEFLRVQAGVQPQRGQVPTAPPLEEAEVFQQRFMNDVHDVNPYEVLPQLPSLRTQ